MAYFKDKRERGCRAGWRLVNLEAEDIDDTNMLFLALRGLEEALGNVRNVSDALFFLLRCNSKAATPK
jgi:hypothetical protein